MKKYASFLILVSILLMAVKSGLSEEVQNPISQLKLTQQSLPEGVKIVKEVMASPKELLTVRMRVGFPIMSLLNQSMIYENDCAQVNYMLMPNEDWLLFGYSKLIEMDGEKSFVFTKDNMIVEVAATKKELETQLAHLLKADPIHYAKIKIGLLPEDWKLLEERCLSRNDVEELQRKYEIPVSSSVVQEFFAGHLKLKVEYYNCGTHQAAENLASLLSGEEKPFFKRTAEFCGTVVALVESQSDALNTLTMSLLNW